MQRDARIVFRATRVEKKTLAHLAARQFRSESEVMRTLLRREAKAWGLWPPTNDQANERVSTNAS